MLDATLWKKIKLLHSNSRHEANQRQRQQKMFNIFITKHLHVKTSIHGFSNNESFVVSTEKNLCAIF